MHGCFVPSCAQVAAWGALAVGTSQEEHCVDDGCQLPCAPRADIESGRCAGTSWTVRAVLLGVSVDGEARADHDHVARNSNAVRHGRALQELHAGFRTAVRTHLAAGGLFVTRSLSHWGTSRVRQITLQLPVPGFAAQPASPVSRHPCGASGRVHHGFRHDDNRVCAIVLVAAAGSPVRPCSNCAHAPRYAQLAPCSSCSSCRLHLSRRYVHDTRDHSSNTVAVQDKPKNFFPNNHANWCTLIISAWLRQMYPLPTRPVSGTAD